MQQVEEQNKIDDIEDDDYFHCCNLDDCDTDTCTSDLTLCGVRVKHEDVERPLKMCPDCEMRLDSTYGVGEWVTE